MDLDGCFGAILVLGVFFYAVYLFVTYVLKYVLAAGAAILTVFALIGAFAGLVKAIINFTKAIRLTLKRREILGKLNNSRYAEDLTKAHPYIWDSASKQRISELVKEEGCDSPSRADGAAEEFYYEDIAAKSYFFGPCFEDVKNIIKYAFKYNFSSMPDFSRGDRWFTRLLFSLWSVVEMIVIVVLGSLFTLTLSLLILCVFLMLELPTLMIAGITLFFRNIFYLSHRISYRCPSCKGEYKIPVYVCPNPDCRMKHRSLRPGFYGIRKRRCICGAVKFPLTASSKGVYIESGTGNIIEFKYSDIRGECPYCGCEYNAGLTKPTSIALIGGASAGKTTFKVAFSYTFLDEEAVRAGLEFSFPDKQSEDEYEKSIKYYKGLDIIPGTNRGISTDISTFSFSLENKRFSASRMIHIYDMPGEVFETGDAKEGWRNYQFTEGMVFLIDPFSLPDIKDKLRDEVASGSMGICSMGMNELVDSLINTLQNERVRKKRNKFAIPVALTINKVDSMLLKKMCGGEAVDALMQGCPEVFSDYFAAMDYVCRCFLAKNGGMGFIANLDNNFSTVHFFFSSPMGYIPQASRTRFRPVNVLPVMQWMMLRADAELAKVWKPELPVRDLTDEERELYKTHSEYYDKYVMELLD